MEVNHISAATKAYNDTAERISQLNATAAKVMPEDYVDISTQQSTISDNAVSSAKTTSSKKVEANFADFLDTAATGNSHGFKTKFNRVLSADNKIKVLHQPVSRAKNSSSGGKAIKNKFLQTLHNVKKANNILHQTQSDESIVKIASAMSDAEINVKIAAQSSKKLIDSWNQLMSMPL